MACWLRLQDYKCPRGKGVHALLDISTADKRNRGVLVTRGMIVIAARQYLTQLEMEAIVEEQCDIGLDGIDTGMLATFKRAFDPNYRPHAAGKDYWEGSIGQFASQLFETGSWNWLATITEIRRKKERAQSNTRNG